MKNDESSHSELIIEPLQLKHLSMLRDENNSKYLGIFQILLCKKWFSSLESSLTNIIPTRNSKCFVAIEENNIISYILATPINRRGSCWSISEPYFIGESISYSRYNLLQNLLRKVLYESNINNTEIIKRTLTSNPAGNANQLTPLVLIRQDKIRSRSHDS